MNAPAAILTPYQVEVLRALRWARERADKHTERTIDGVTTGGWKAPMDFGGRNGSHHSKTATALAIRGLVDRYKTGWGYGQLNKFKSRSKGSCVYRITDAGLIAINSLDKAK